MPFTYKSVINFSRTVSVVVVVYRNPCLSDVAYIICCMISCIDYC